ncbi:MAG TPA: ABC transporter permease [Trebonia sp.]|jgi:peptide/nickel transport system permease protein|nr:ABC transporter permease [Trebonia sp.]
MVSATATLTPDGREPTAAGAAHSRLSRLGGSLALRMIGRRLLLAIPVVWGTTLLTFCLMNLLPGTAATALLGDDATPQAVALLNHKLGLDQPFWTRYFEWLWHAVQGNLGVSLASGQRVTSLVGQRLEVSAELIAGAFLIGLVASVVIATLAARKPNGIAAWISVAVATIGLSLPPFVISLVLVFVFAVKLKVVPPLGFVSMSTNLGWNLRTLILPAVSLALPIFAVFNRMLRADLLDQMQTEDYITTARAKGASPWRVLVRHALRNSLFGLLTVAGMQVGVLLGTTVVVEQIFSVPGIGQQLLSAIQNQDVPVVEGIVAVIATITVLANLITDVLYAALDPRIRNDSASS